MTRKIALTLIALSVFMMTATVFVSAKTIKGTVYSNSIKVKGNIVYCTNENSIFKVNTKTEAVKRIAEGKATRKYCCISEISKKGKYIYYCYDLGPNIQQYRRVKVSGGKVKKIVKAYEGEGFILKGRRLYYTTMNYKNYKCERRFVKVSGKGKKKVKDKLKVRHKVSNVKGYKVKIKRTDDTHYDSWLVTPDGTKIFLENAKMSEDYM